jgi:2-succinyl-5-enolpyruvyl-6-hydroxy-3-cyclohexene-1-carboxylate synthase
VTRDTGRANLAHASALVDALAGQGVRHAVVCPGSRSTPVAVALAAHPDVRIWVHIDERSAGFFALGMARQLREPVGLLSTSGTAAANFLPAVAEASLSRVPLVVLTADRPPELREWGAAQTIDQIRLYGSHAKWFADLPVPVDDAGLIRSTRAAASRAAQTAGSAPAGPVHLNLPFREPLLPVDLAAPLRLEPQFAAGRSVGRGIARRPSRLISSEPVVGEIADVIRDAPQGIVVCGPGESPELPGAAAAFAEASGYPLLADPLSGLRFGPHDRSRVIDAYDPFLRDREIADRLMPEVVIRIGAPPTSKPLQQFLASCPDAEQIAIDAGSPRDPGHLAARYVRGDEAETLRALAVAVGARGSTPDRGWLERWRGVDRVTRDAIAQSLAECDELSEGGVAADVAALLPDGATLIAGNSMPIRDVDAFVRGDERTIRLLGNRGANGIDGMTSTALGAAAVADPVVLLVGDLSFLHDVGGLIAARLFDLSATIVVVNNDGGGIFSFLPQAQQIDPDTFEKLFGTPTGFDVGGAARLFGASHARPVSRCAFRRDLGRALAEPGLSVVEVVTDRARNVAEHRAIWGAVAEALREAERVGA